MLLDFWSTSSTCSFFQIIRFVVPSGSDSGFAMNPCASTTATDLTPRPTGPHVHETHASALSWLPRIISLVLRSPHDTLAADLRVSSSAARGCATNLSHCMTKLLTMFLSERSGTKWPRNALAKTMAHGMAALVGIDAADPGTSEVAACLASVFGSEMATRAYSEAATHADLDDTEEGEEAEHGEETVPPQEGRVNEGGKGLGEGESR